MGRMIVRTGVSIAAFLAIAMLVPSGGQYGCARAQSAASLTELSSGAGTAIVATLSVAARRAATTRSPRLMTMSSSTLRLTRKVRRRELCTRLVGDLQSDPHVKPCKMDAGIPHSP